MATSVFQPFVDKENVTATGPMVPGKGLAFGKSNIRGAKTFLKSNTPHSLPRKALGDVNREPARTNLGDSNMTFKKPTKTPSHKLFSTPVPSTKATSKPQSHKIHGHGLSNRTKTEQKRTAVLKDVMEKENMPSYAESDDDFEDIVPKTERVSTYLDKLMTWRPSRLCSMGITYDSDDEPYSKRELPEPEPCKIEDSTPFSLEEVPIEEIALPTLADLGLDINEELDSVPEL